MNTDWAKIAYELRQQNRDLTKMVFQLEQALAESQGKLQAYVQESLSQAISAQPAEDEVQQQIAHLLQEIAASYQVVQHQQIIAKLTKQLETSQARVAELERDCALLQESYSEQNHQLAATTEQAQELQISLQRQQQQTVEYRASLDQCRSESESTLPSPRTVENERSQAPAPSLQESLTILPWSEYEAQSWLTEARELAPSLNARRDPLTQVQENAVVGTTKRLVPAHGTPLQEEAMSNPVPSYLLHSAKKRTKTIELPKFV